MYFLSVALRLHIEICFHTERGPFLPAPDTLLRGRSCLVSRCCYWRLCSVVSVLKKKQQKSSAASMQKELVSRECRHGHTRAHRLLGLLPVSMPQQGGEDLELFIYKISLREAEGPGLATSRQVGRAGSSRRWAGGLANPPESFSKFRTKI